MCEGHSVHIVGQALARMRRSRSVSLQQSLPLCALSWYIHGYQGEVAMKKIIETKHAPAAVGPYAQAYLVNDTLYVSGQIPFVPETMQLVSDDVAVQTKRSLENIA